ncbi:hypothetical protein L9F63_017546, partial [Diploptera punctata]
NLTGILKVPDILLNTFSVICGAVSMGFLTATLEPHIRMFELSPVVTGVVFVISGISYGISAPVYGRLCDRQYNPKLMMAFGSMCIMGGYFLIGPLPGTDLPQTLWMIIVGLVMEGFGTAAIMVPCFSDILSAAYKRGFPNDLSTYGVVSGIWASAFSLGAFIGPSMAGFLYDKVGFQLATLFPISAEIAIFVSVFGFILCRRRRRMVLVSNSNGNRNGQYLHQEIPLISTKQDDNVDVNSNGYNTFGSQVF